MKTQRIQGQLPPCEIGLSLMGLVHLLWRLACCRPGRNCPVSFRLQSLCLFLKRVTVFSVLVPTPDFLLQQGLISPWYSHELILASTIFFRLRLPFVVSLVAMVGSVLRVVLCMWFCRCGIPPRQWVHTHQSPLGCQWSQVLAPHCLTSFVS